MSCQVTETELQELRSLLESECPTIDEYCRAWEALPALIQAADPEECAGLNLRDKEFGIFDSGVAWVPMMPAVWSNHVIVYETWDDAGHIQIDFDGCTVYVDGGTCR